jgi:hypothetical protein
MVYVVLRVDGGLDVADLGPSELGPEIRFDEYDVTAKEVVTTHAEAMREVARLNALNEDKTCRYFWTGSRFFPDGGSFGGGPGD